MSSSNIINFNHSFEVIRDEIQENSPLLGNEKEESEKDTISHSSSSSLYQMTKMETFSFIATHILYSKKFQYYYVFIILLSAISIILSYTMKCAKFSVIIIEGLIVILLTLEIIIKLLALKKYFFYSFWNILDLIIVVICIFLVSLTKRKCEKGDNLIDNSILIIRYVIQIIRLGILLRKNQSTENRRNRIRSVNFGHIKRQKNYDSFTDIENKSFAYDNSILDTGVGSISHSAQNFVFDSYTQGYCYIDENDKSNISGNILKNNDFLIRTDQIGLDDDDDEIESDNNNDDDDNYSYRENTIDNSNNVNNNGNDSGNGNNGNGNSGIFNNRIINGINNDNEDNYKYDDDDDDDDDDEDNENIDEKKGKRISFRIMEGMPNINFNSITNKESEIIDIVPSIQKSNSDINGSKKKYSHVMAPILSSSPVSLNNRTPSSSENDFISILPTNNINIIRSGNKASTNRLYINHFQHQHQIKQQQQQQQQRHHQHQSSSPLSFLQQNIISPILS